MKKNLLPTSIHSLLLFGLTVVFSQALANPAVAERIWVSVNGNDDNPGTRAEPFRTVAKGCLSLEPGDRLNILSGDYENEGNIPVRYVDPETFEFFPLKGTKQKPIVINGVGSKLPRIFGNFDVRGSYIRIQRLEIIGDQESLNPKSVLPGVGVYESHDVMIYKNIVRNHGGGGIQFNHSDRVAAYNNVTLSNAIQNPDQHSGISSYQPIIRNKVDPLGSSYGVRICNNVSCDNRNEVPTASGNITDGNGIIIDDHRYTQFNNVLADVLFNNADPQVSSGQPVISVDENGDRLPYARPSLVCKNLCLNNGGRGIHVFLSDDVYVNRNTVGLNLKSPELTEVLPRDESGKAFFVFGEITVADSNNVKVAYNDLFAGAVDDNESVAAAELFFEFDGIPTSNRWFGNSLDNFREPSALISVNGGNQSDLLEFSGQ